MNFKLLAIVLLGCLLAPSVDGQHQAFDSHANLNRITLSYNRDLKVFYSDEKSVVFASG
jgi:hypothetical protein